MGTKIKEILEEFKKGRKDFDNIALETKASIATVKTQYAKFKKNGNQPNI